MVSPRVGLLIAVAGPVVFVGVVAFDGLAYPSRPTWLVVSGYGLALALMVFAFALMWRAMRGEEEDEGEGKSGGVQPGPGALLLGFGIWPIVYFGKRAAGNKRRRSPLLLPRGALILYCVGFMITLGAAIAYACEVNRLAGLPVAVWAGVGIILWVLARLRSRRHA